MGLRLTANGQQQTAKRDKGIMGMLPMVKTKFHDEGEGLATIPCFPLDQQKTKWEMARG